ncbi:MAG TPA: DUF222 domain-containing protein [Frankiaceae bacterium]|nr:DUF222 domain-containing protein [Frankiaceae bacterium]
MFEYLSPHGVVAAALIAPPGPEVLAALAPLACTGLSPSARVDLLVALERQVSWLSAVMQPTLAAVADAVEVQTEALLDSSDPADMPLRAAHAEIGAALRIADSTAASQLHTARTLTHELPMVHAALAAGEITFKQADAIVECTSDLTVLKAQQVAAKVLGRASHQTVGQLRRCLRRAVLAADPEAAADRAAKAPAERTVDWWPLPDGMAELRLIASATDVIAVFDAASAIARQLKEAGPKRGTDGWQPIAALRSDALVHLATGCSQPPRPAAVNITVDPLTLLGLQDNPGELAGYGPLPAPLARILAADGRWRRMILHPLTGALLDLGHTSYRPSTQLARFVNTRDRTCVFPTCSRAAERCEIDHRQPYRPGDPTGGRTDRSNLHPECGNHHKVKHRSGWTLRTTTTTNTTTTPGSSQPTWVSPLGRHYPLRPEDHRTADPEPCPF